MKRYIKSAVALLLAFVIVISSYVPVYSASSSYPTTYSKTSNSGEKNEVCIALNGTSAISYYTGSYEYDDLINLSSSTLRTRLETLMKSTHTKTTSYSECQSKAKYSDCQNNDTSRVTLIYTSVNTTSSDWNREHVWPKSKGNPNLGTSGPGADMHHIRPSDNQVNSYRSSLRFGEASSGKQAIGKNAANGVLGGYYTGSYFEPLDDVKGDVARICLYMYVRYGTSHCQSITSVFQSVDVLLQWCKDDPVDTWEMGRNEVVQAIQGNRNVFIDYPELAWVLFGKAIPSDMTTPSGEAKGGNSGSGSGSGSTNPSCTHTNTTIKNVTAATCGATGYTGDTYCNDCNTKIASGTTVPATGKHTTATKNQKDATCGAAGYTGDVYCIVCSTVTVKGSTISATGLHSYTAWVINTTSNTKTRSCTGCSKTETVAIDAAECTHTNTAIRNQKDATCGSEGYTGDSCCTYCNEIVSYGTSIAATGNHNYSETIVITQPTITAKGEGKQVCLSCSHEKNVTIPPYSADLEGASPMEILGYAGSDEDIILIMMILGKNEGLFVGEYTR